MEVRIRGKGVRYLRDGLGYRGRGRRWWYAKIR